MSDGGGTAFSEDPGGEQANAVRIEVDGAPGFYLTRHGPIRHAHRFPPGLMEELRGRAAEAEHVLGEPAQLRWQSEDGALRCGRAEPIAAPLPWGRRSFTPHPGDQWSRANAGEVFPAVMTPLTSSAVIDALDNGFHAPWEGLTEGRRFAALFDGYLYFNVGLMLELLRGQFGVRTSLFLLAVGGPEAEQLPEERTLWPRLVRSLPLLLRRVRAQKRLPARWERERRQALHRRDELRGIDAEQSSDRSLLRRLTVSGLYSAEFVKFLMECQTAAFGQIQFLLWLSESWIGEREFALRLLQGLPGVLTAESNLALWTLAERAAADDAAAALVAETEPAQLLDALAADPQGEWLHDALREFLSEHGHRAAAELELSEPRWVERPELLLDTFRGYVLNPNQNSAGRLRGRQAADRAAAEREAERILTRTWFDRLLPLRWLFFREQMREAQRLQPLRENPKYVLLQLSLEQRRLWLLLGRRWQERGAIENAEDVFWLLEEDITALARRSGDPETAGRMRSRIRRRRAQYDQWAASPAPPIRDHRGRPRRSAAVGSEMGSAGSEALRGIAASAGTASGPARVAATPAEGRRLAAGEILVARFTDPGWTPIFPLAAAVVTEIGGMLSHGAVVAREYGIPAVVNVPGVTSKVRTGDILSVNGATGEITVRPAAAP